MICRSVLELLWHRIETSRQLIAKIHTMTKKIARQFASLCNFGYLLLLLIVLQYICYFANVKVQDIKFPAANNLASHLPGVLFYDDPLP